MMTTVGGAITNAEAPLVVARALAEEQAHTEGSEHWIAAKRRLRQRCIFEPTDPQIHHEIAVKWLMDEGMYREDAERRIKENRAAYEAIVAERARREARPAWHDDSLPLAPREPKS